MASWYDPKMVRRTGYAIPNSSSNKREHNFRKVLVTPPGAVILTPLVLKFLGGKIFRERLPSPPSGFANSEKVGWHPPFRGDHAAFPARSVGSMRQITSIASPRPRRRLERKRIQHSTSSAISRFPPLRSRAQIG